MSASLVTGGAGFLGSHVARLRLQAGDEVVVLDDLSGGSLVNVPSGARFVEGSVSDPSAVAAVFDATRFDYVFHLAAYAAEGLSHFIRRFNYTNNIVGSMNVLNECVNHEVRCLVFTSSIAVYGAAQPPMTEAMRPEPEDPYGIAKYAVELDLAAARTMFGLNSIVFRPHNVYGEGQNIADRYRNVIGIFMNQVMRGQPMTVFGDGQQTRAFSHIDDVAPIIAASVERPDVYNQTFNVGADKPYTVAHLAEVVAEAFGVSPVVEHLTSRLEVVDAYASHDRARAAFGVRDGMSLDEGIRRMAEWARSVGPLPRSTFSGIEIPRNLPPSWQAINEGTR